MQRARRLKHPLATLMVDVDNFKQVNDTYGHAAGDEVLRAVAARTRSHLRDIDLLGRYGGDEFVVFLVETELEAARRVGERICQGVAAMPVVIDQGPLNVTISVGVARLAEEGPNVAALVNDADVALYAAKKAGKNQVAAKDASQRPLD